MSSLAEPSPQPAAASESAAPASRWARWSDRCNPILVRELLQATKGRVFVLTVIAALAITVVIASRVAGNYDPRGGSGRDALHAGLATLLPMLVFIVPMQAYHSMRLELRAGIVEQLLLSQLRPMNILFGKLQTAMVQFVLYVAVVSPLLATSYLLRGVDVPTILVSLLFAAIACITATSLAVSSAAQAILPGLQPIANLATAFGLGMGGFLCAGFIASGEYSEVIGFLLRSDYFWAVIAAVVLMALVGITVSLLAARSFLVHAFENKATPFRVFLFVLPVLAYGWLYLFLEPTARAAAVPIVTLVLLLVGVVFGVFMVTEQRELSPRLRAHAPGGLLGVLSAPFLPGRDRGTACYCLFTAVLVVVAYWLWPTSAVPGIVRDLGFTERVGMFMIAYAFVFLGLGRWLRARLTPALQGNFLARFLLPLALFVFILVPLLIDAFARGHVGQWHLGHVLNPFFTTDYYAFRTEYWFVARTPLWWAIVIGAVLQLPACWRGVHEVVAAAKARKSRPEHG